MKAWAFSLLGLAGLLVILWASQDVEATGTCQPTVPTANVCHGYSHVSTKTGGDGTNAICFVLRVPATTPTCTTSGITPVNESTWELDAGACITFRYYSIQSNALLSPPPPNKVSIWVIYDASSTVVRMFQTNGADPVDGTSYSFCATSDGTAGGSPRAGQYYLDVRAIKDNSAGGLQDYNIRSNGVATVGSILSYDSGFIRARMFVSDITRTAYPSGSTFAYGQAGDETMTITGTFTLPGGDMNVETMRTFITDDATLALGQAGATVDVDSGSLAQGFVVDNTFTTSPFTAAGGLTIIGNGYTGEKWTVLAATGHGASLTRLSDTSIRITATFNIDAGVKFDSDGAGSYGTADEIFLVKLTNSGGPTTSLFNLGETYYAEGYLFNARSELLSRSMTIAREDATPTTCASSILTPTANKYSGTGLLGSGGCLAANTGTGSARYFRATNTDQSHRSNQAFAASSLYYVDSHIQVASTLVPDDYPTEDAGEYFAYTVQGDGMGGDMSDTVRQWCHVDGVRHDLDIDTTGSAITRTIKDPTTATRATGTTDTGSDGWTPTAQTLLASSPLGTTWTALCSVSYLGNTGTDTETFTTQVPAGVGDTFQADPLKAFATYNPATDKVRVAISAAFLDGTARTGAAADLYVDAWNEALTPVVSAANPTELPGTAYGVYTYDFTPATEGIFTVRVRTVDPDTMEPITVGNDLLVQNGTSADLAAVLGGLEEHRDNSIEVLMTSDFQGIGFDGFLFFVLFLVLLIFFWWMEMPFAAGWTIPAIFTAVVPSFGLNFLVCVVFIIIGLGMQFFKERERKSREESGVEPS